MTRGRQWEKVEKPLLDLLFDCSPHPTLDIARKCFQEQHIQDAAISVAEKVRLAGNDLHGTGPAHYDGFLVGAVGIGLKPSAGRKNGYTWCAYADHNTKPHQKDTKYCGEMRVMRTADEEECICFVGIVVVGNLRKEDKTRTLHPCEACRALMRRKYRFLFHPTTIVLTATPGAKIREVHTVEALMNAHLERWP